MLNKVEIVVLSPDHLYMQCNANHLKMSKLIGGFLNLLNAPEQYNITVLADVLVVGIL